jgi:hypothetical protein
MFLRDKAPYPEEELIGHKMWFFGWEDGWNACRAEVSCIVRIPTIGLRERIPTSVYRAAVEFMKLLTARYQM